MNKPLHYPMQSFYIYTPMWGLVEIGSDFKQTKWENTVTAFYHTPRLNVSNVVRKNYRNKAGLSVTLIKGDL